MTDTHAHRSTDRADAVRKATFFNRISIGYNLVEAGIALAAGVAAHSTSLVGFGLDSVIEVSASLILAWRLLRERSTSCTQEADRRATKAIAVSFLFLAMYITYESLTRLMAADRPDTSLVGILLTTLSLLIMPFFARAKHKLAPALGSRAQQAEANQTQLCAYMSATVLVGLLAHTTLGWWWADPVAALGLAVLATIEAVNTWRADSLADTCCA